MQFKPTLTESEILTPPWQSPEDLLTHPIDKIKCVAEIILNLNANIKKQPFPDLPAECVGTLGEILADAVSDVEYLAELSADAQVKLKRKLDKQAEQLGILDIATKAVNAVDAEDSASS